jgi:isoquinoline 1-oxidoreductase alpha subunit
VQQAWIDNQVPQCGYCQSGLIMAVAGVLAQTPRPTDDEIDAGITNICRCGTFVRVRKAIHQLAGSEGAA